MTPEVKVCRRVDQFDIAEETTTRIPTRVEFLLRGGYDEQLVRLSVAQLLGDVQFEAYITIVRTTNALSVEVDIAHKHDALEIEQYTTAFERGIGGDGTAVEAQPHLLETSSREA